MKIHLDEMAYHRNGVLGWPFWVVTFTERDGGETRNMVAVLFDDGTPQHPRTAVLEREQLADGVIAFGENSWRGDRYDGPLRAAMRKRVPDAFGEEVAA